MVGSSSAGASRDDPRLAHLRVPVGVLALPFVVGVALVLLVALAMRDPITMGWVMLALLAGVILAAGSLATRIATKHPARIAHATTGVIGKPHHEAMGGDPLAHIHAVEQQGRRHRRPCVNCGTMVKSGQEACPSCGQKQLYACKGCRTQVRLDWSTCPECGRNLP